MEKGVNFNSILNKYNDTLPVKNIKIVKAFKYDKPIGRDIFNYNVFAKDLKKGMEDNVCICSDVKYKSFIDDTAMY